MNWIHRILFALCVIVPAHSADENRHIVAAYPINFPIEEFAELLLPGAPPADNRFLHKSDHIFGLNPKSETLVQLPKSSLSYLCFNRDTQTIVAKASADYHFQAVIQDTHNYLFTIVLSLHQRNCFAWALSERYDKMHD